MSFKADKEETDKKKCDSPCYHVQYSSLYWVKEFLDSKGNTEPLWKDKDWKYLLKTNQVLKTDLKRTKKERKDKKKKLRQTRMDEINEELKRTGNRRRRFEDAATASNVRRRCQRRPCNCVQIHHVITTYKIKVNIES